VIVSEMTIRFVAGRLFDGSCQPPFFLRLLT